MFYLMDKLNLLPPFTELYYEQLKKLSEQNYKDLRKLPIDAHVKCFNTMHRVIDFQRVNLT